MDEQAFSTAEVIVALQNIGISQEIIEYVVPIAGYESRVEGTPFTRDALDKLSPSWGIFQANVDSMAPGIYKAMNELGVEVPGMTEEQKKVLIENKALTKDQKKFLYFTKDQKEFVVNWFKNQADLDANALVFKYILEQKMKDKNTNDFKVAIDSMYPMTVSKFNNLNNEDAQSLKTKISDEVQSFYNEPDRGIPVPSETFDPTEGMEEDMTITNGTVPPTTNTTVPDVKEPNQPLAVAAGPTTSRFVDDRPSEDATQVIDTTTRSPGITNQFGTPPQDEIPLNIADGYKIGIEMLEKQVNKQRQELGLTPLAKQDVNQVQRNTVRQTLLDALDLLGG